jgi:hypothetical protein
MSPNTRQRGAAAPGGSRTRRTALQDVPSIAVVTGTSGRFLWLTSGCHGFMCPTRGESRPRREQAMNIKMIMLEAADGGNLFIVRSKDAVLIRTVKRVLCTIGIKDADALRLKKARQVAQLIYGARAGHTTRRSLSSTATNRLWIGSHATRRAFTVRGSTWSRPSSIRCARSLAGSSIPRISRHDFRSESCATEDCRRAKTSTPRRGIGPSVAVATSLSLNLVFSGSKLAPTRSQMPQPV